MPRPHVLPALLDVVARGPTDSVGGAGRGRAGPGGGPTARRVDMAGREDLHRRGAAGHAAYAGHTRMVRAPRGRGAGAGAERRPAAVGARYE